MNFSITSVEIIFLATIIITFCAAYLGRKHADKESVNISNERLNKWLVGLSAGATANSGFIVTGAVGLGYSFGPQWLFLPLAWFLGDLVFWKYFPGKINEIGRKANANTLTEIIQYQLVGKTTKLTSLFITLLIIVCLGGYLAAQWLAGQKFMHGAFEFSAVTSLLLFAGVIIAYSSIGGFRGSVYTDALQALIRIVGTALALVAVIILALNKPEFYSNWTEAGESFSQLLPGNSISSVIFFILGYAFAACGFGLGQPQIISRYLAGRSPKETMDAKWIYISFVQFTWISMTAFGVILRGVMPGLEDPESGLSFFIKSYFGEILTGIVVADVFATIAATSNSILVSMAQVVAYHFFPKSISGKSNKTLTSMVIIFVGLVTMIASTYFSQGSSVFSLALGAVSLLAAGVAAPVLITVLDFSRTSGTLLFSMIAGVCSSLLWKYFGLDSVINEAAIGISLGMLTNWILFRILTLWSIQK